MPDDLTLFLCGMYQHIERLQKAMSQQQLLTISLLGVLRKSYPGFEQLYAEQFSAAKESPIAKDNAAVLAVISQLIQQMGSDDPKGLDEA